LEVWAAKFPDQPKFKYILSNRPGPGTAEPVIIRVGSGSVYTSLLCALETGPSFGPHFLQGQKKRPTFIEKAHWYRRFVGKIAAKIEAQIQKINNIYTFFTLSNKKLKTKKKKKKKERKKQRNATLLSTGLPSRSQCKKKLKIRRLKVPIPGRVPLPLPESKRLLLWRRRRHQCHRYQTLASSRRRATSFAGLLIHH
jgi:hypothetical protein